MDLHQNARLTPKSRELLALFVLHQGRSLNTAAATFRVSRRTAAKWVTRYRLGGKAALQDRSSRPRRSPRRLSQAVHEQVLAWRRQQRTGREIAMLAGISRASVSRLLRRAHLSRWRDLHPLPPARRYEHPFPGDLLHLDIKALGRFQGMALRGDGRRRGLRKRCGWEALHVAIDDHSRLAFSCVLPNQTADTAITFLGAALAFYRRHGIHIRRLLTDNGHCYRSLRFAQACAELGLQHRFTRPYRPCTNGKAERFIQTSLREWAYARCYDSSDQRNQWLSAWLHHYNYHRPHGSLAYAPPISRVPLDGNNLLILDR
jgi:transposase InsO family protein